MSGICEGNLRGILHLRNSEKSPPGNYNHTAKKGKREYLKVIKKKEISNEQE
jgi:hypothetical protein